MSMNSPAQREAKVEKLRPPEPEQPFDKKWQAPSAPADIGGPALDEVAIEPSKAAPALAPEMPVKRHSKSRKTQPVKGPWDFPRF
jgi:hypothetical protein